MVRFSLLANALPKADANATTDQKVTELMDYQVQLLEYLRYALSNLEEDNFSETGLKHILEPVLVEVKGVDGKVAKLAVTADTVSAMVESIGEDGKVTAASIALKLAEDESLISIIANKVDISGFVTFNDLEKEGATVVNGSNITTGEIRAVNFIAKGDINSFIVHDENDVAIGSIGYSVVEDEEEYKDKLWLTTNRYIKNGMYYYPAIKLEAAGGVSIESGENGVFIYDGSGVEWMFRDGNLSKYEDGEWHVVA